MVQHVSFRDIFKRVERPLEVEDGTEYECVGVKWWGKGAFVREIKFGDEIRKKRQYHIKSGDIVYNKLFAWRGAFAIASEEVNDCIVSDKFPTYRLVSDDILPEYLQLLFQSPSLAATAEKKSTGMAAMSKFTLNPPRFWELTIPLVPKGDQARIIKLIQDCDAEIQKATTAAHHLETDSDYLVRSTIAYLTREYPRVKLRSFTKLVRRSVNVQDDVNYKQVTIGMNNSGVRLRGFKEGFAIGVKNQARVHLGDLVFSRIDMRNGAIGFVPEELDGAIVGNDFPVCVIDEKVSKNYLEWCFKTKDFRQQSEAKSAGATNRRKMKRDNFLNLEVPLPERRIQDSLALKFEKLNLEADRIRHGQVETLKYLNNIRSILLRKAYEGRL